ncbi:hypothetical protein OCK74_24790 [Chitinophagaceae bacterium LB-8]|jgi:hypothetical protein|uniref:Uncharacterized protein n=1 Tax=Paraflavisolibacter caeni TaxID=2982496 RepID=A0A9X2XZX7_9BACT|nr:hypothetical protein [Paraflavisolibacter caeni]MCU7552360.1 hypothetical protein [Paraflavisolibacter caeni]
MKRILILLLPVFTGIISYSQIQTGYSYSMAIPVGRLAENINLTHSAVFDVLYKFHSAPKLRTGVQFGWGTYAHKKEDQHYVFRDGSTTDVKVNFSSNVFNGHLVAAYDLLSKGGLIPYVTVKTGVSKFYTKIYIPDPNESGNCRPLENKNVFKDATWSAGGGAGARMNANSIFKKSKSNRLWFDFSVNYLTGGNVEYLNVKHLEHEHTDGTGQNAKDFNVRFVNVTTNELHEHHVSKVLNSRINQIDMKVGAVLSFN